MSQIDDHLQYDLEELAKINLKIYEPSVLEAQFSFSMRKQQQSIQGYEFSAYFLYPSQSRINQNNYPIEHFYSDFITLLRLREPKLSFKNLINEKDEYATPIGEIKEYIDKMKKGVIAESPDLYIKKAKLFGCSFQRFFSRKLKKILMKEILEQDIQAILTLLKKSELALTTWRKLIADLSGLPVDLLLQLKQEMTYVDEYCSILWREGLISIFAEVNKRDRKLFLDVLNKLRAYIRLERWYSLKKNYVWIDAKSSSNLHEEYLFRRGLLKRKIWQVLYLDIRTKPLFRLEKQLGAMIAAGIAGAWAIVITLMIDFSALSKDNSQNYFGMGSAVAIAVLTLAYVLKDRIKEIGRYYLGKGIFAVADNKYKIEFQQRIGAFIIGYLKEKARYIKFSELKESIKEVIKKYNYEISTDRMIIKYKKSLHFDQNSLKSFPKDFKGLRYLMRFNLNAFLSSLDLPSTHIALSDHKITSIKEVNVKKVYHFDLILHLSTKKSVITDKIYYYRLILSKEGILRIEQLDLEHAGKFT